MHPQTIHRAVPPVLSLPPEAFEALREFLEARGYRFEGRANQIFLASGRGAVVSLYTTGKVVLGGRDVQEHQAIEEEVRRLGGSEAPRKELPPLVVEGPHIGTDEVGKGDYFGPLVIGGCAVEPDKERWLREWGVKDSKLVADAQVPRLAQGIRQILGEGKWDVVSISPERYNQLHDEMGSVNQILAWGHARVIENLLEANPTFTTAVTDQFGDASLVESKLMARGKSIKLIQAYGGERDVAVAAASLLAREEFLRRLRALGREWGIALPRGATQVIGFGRRFVREHGAANLGKVAKLHFRTTEAVLSPGGGGEESDDGK